MLGKTIVIAVAGPSGSGKSWLAEHVANEIKATSKVVLLAEDSYFRQQSHLSPQQREQTNYDHPDAIDETLLVDHITELKSGGTVESPVYDYQTHDRSAAVVPLGPCEVLIVEGILLLHRQAVREQADLCVFVDAPEETCLARRLRRDTIERGRTEESVITQFEQTVKPMLRQFVEPSKSHADMIVENSGGMPSEIDELLRRIRSLIASR